MKFLLLAALVAVATAAPGLVQRGPTGPVPAPNHEDSFISKAIDPAVIDYFKPVSVGPLIVEGFGPIAVRAAKVDKPVDFSSISPYVQIDIKVDAAPGSVVTVNANGCACRRALGAAPVSHEPIPPV